MNACYILVNCYHIIRLYLERTTLFIPPEFKAIYQTLFSAMRPYEFMKFIKRGQQTSVPKNNFFCREGDEKNFLTLVIDGAVTIEKQSTVLTTLSGYFFIGEMRYLTGKPMSADVRALSELTCITKLSEALGRDLVHKIQKSSNLL
jgi:CRP-like cAMP-binding protein